MSDIAPIEIVEEEFIQEPSLDIFANEENKQLLIDYIARELEETSTNAGRDKRISRNTVIKRQREARPESETKDFPWPNASNIVPPVSLQNINVITTKILNSMNGKKPLFKYETNDPKFKNHSDALTRHVQKQVEDPNGIDLYPKLWDVIYDCVSFGTQFAKVPYTVKEMKFNRKSETNGVERVKRIIKSTPEVVPLPFEDFLTRPEWADLQTAPWCGARYYKYAHELRALQAQGFYQNVELVLSEQTGFDDEKKETMDLQGIEPTDSNDPVNYLYAIYEVNVFWDADEDGVAEDLIIHIEKESKTILRAEYNELGIRDYVRLPYINIPTALYGLGVGDIVMDSQIEAEALHNMRVNNQQLAMAPFVVTSDATNFKSQALTPGKILRTPIPKEDVVVHKLPDVSGSVMAAEALVIDQASKATGVSDVLSGRDPGGSNRVGATGVQFLGGQSNGYLDSISSQFNHAFNMIPMLILFQNVKNYALLDLTDMSEADQLLLNEVYSMNVEDIPSKFKFKARLAKIEDSKAAKQGEALNLFQLYMAYGDKIGQLASYMSDPNLQNAPQVMETMQTYYVGLTKLMNKVLEGFDEDNVGDYLPFIADLELMLSQQDVLRQQGVNAVEQSSAQAQAGGVDGTLSNDGLGGGSTDAPQEDTTGGAQGTGEVPEGSPTIGGAPI